MKKSDLKTGMRVVNASGRAYVVMILDHDAHIVCGNSWDRLDNFSDDLKNAHPHLNIQSVYKQPHAHDLLNPNEMGEKIWEREETILTLDGVEYSESTLRSLIKKATQ